MFHPYTTKNKTKNPSMLALGCLDSVGLATVYMKYGGWGMDGKTWIGRSKKNVLKHEQAEEWEIKQ